MSEGISVFLTSRNEEKLLAAQKRLGGLGVHTICVPTDVSDAQAVAHLADRAYAEFSEVHLLINNAGSVVLNGIRPGWTPFLDDWEYTMSANLWGVIHGVREFVPRMLNAGTEGHVVNVSSGAGLVTGIDMGMYRITKHAVVSLSGTLAIRLEASGAPIGVSVVCPGEVATDIALATIELAGGIPEDIREIAENARDSIAAGMNPMDVADIVFQGIEQRILYVLTHADSMSGIEERYQSIVADHAMQWEY